MGDQPRPPKVVKPRYTQRYTQRWEMLGKVVVDSASMMIVDPMYGIEQQREIAAPGPGGASPLSWPTGDRGLGVSFLAGLGDGEYEVWGRVVDYLGDVGERVAEVRVVLITQEDLDEWNAMP